MALWGLHGVSQRNVFTAKYENSAVIWGAADITGLGLAYCQLVMTRRVRQLIALYLE